MRKTTLLSIFTLFLLSTVYAQTYDISDFVSVNDTVYLTQAQIGMNDYSTTGTNYTWDFSTLTGSSQEEFTYHNPVNVGFNFIQWPYLYDANNTNIAKAQNESLTIGAYSITDVLEFYLKGTNSFSQKASSYTIILNDINVSIKNEFDSPDVQYVFPLSYGDTNTSTSSYTTDIPTLFYEEKETVRTNTVDGTGTITTPYNTFTNVLRHESVTVVTDTIAILNTGTPTTVTTSREYTWFAPGEKYPVLTVKQKLVGSEYVTQSVSYLDEKQLFEPTALFVYYPVLPEIDEEIIFQNLSFNASTYTWDFGDASSTSSLVNPTHIYTAAGTYNVHLIAFNDSVSDEVTIPITVSESLGIEYLNKNDISIYPNPIKDHINLKIAVPFQKADVKLYDLQGELIWYDVSNSATISIDNLHIGKGIFLLKVMLDDEKVSLFKIVKM